MQAPSRIAIVIAAVIALSACSEVQMPLSAEKSPMVSNAPAVEADPSSPPPAAISVGISGICNIESIGGLSGPALDGIVRVESDTTVSGWRAYQAADGTEADAWLRILGQDGDVAFQTPLAATVDRPDVVETVNRASALRMIVQSLIQNNDDIGIV